MVITFKTILIVTVIVETILWINSVLISEDRYRKIKKLESDKEGLLESLNEARRKREECCDIIVKRDKELSLEKQKYKKCIEYINKINKEYKIK